jgi:hypothetical protein
MPERRGSGRNIAYWHATCQREGCGHPRIRHLTNPKPMCTAIVYADVADTVPGPEPVIGRCDCTEFQEVIP